MDEIDWPESAARPIAHWRIILAAILDFFSAFFVFGIAIALVSGGISEGGISLGTRGRYQF